MLVILCIYGHNFPYVWSGHRDFAHLRILQSFGYSRSYKILNLWFHTQFRTIFAIFLNPTHCKAESSFPHWTARSQWPMFFCFIQISYFIFDTSYFGYFKAEILLGIQTFPLYIFLEFFDFVSCCVKLAFTKKKKLWSRLLFRFNFHKLTCDQGQVQHTVTVYCLL